MTTYYARVDYSYSGDSKFTIPFSYIKKEHIVVLVNDVKTTNYTYITSSQIEVKDELQAEDVVSIRRTTPIKDKLVNFTDLNILNGETQNLAQQQVFNAVQEMYDKNEQQSQDFQKDIDDYKEEIEDKIQEVKDATDAINTFKESVKTCIDKAEESTKAAKEAALESSKVESSREQIETNKTDIENLIQDVNKSNIQITINKNDIIKINSRLPQIGAPIPTLSDNLPDNAIWLEGAEVAKVDYPKLYAVYGDTYGTPTDENNFKLPDARDRVLWGTTESNFGYLSASLPNITGHFYNIINPACAGAFKVISTNAWGGVSQSNSSGGIGFDASRSNPIYKDGSTVVPPALKSRIYTYYA